MFFTARQILAEDNVQKLSSQPHITLINQNRIISKFFFIFSSHFLNFLSQHFLNTFHFHLNTFFITHVSQRIEKGYHTFTIHRFEPRYRSSNRIDDSPTVTYQIITSSTGCPNGRPVPAEISDRITIIIT